jgi:glycerophosphoryl diester phosphodiesterase
VIELGRRDGRPLRIGHKGAAALAPENTLASFEAAVALHVDLVEFDILALRDGALVIAHSGELSELSHGAARGVVGDRSLAELRRIAPGLPTLDDALDFFAERAPATGLHIDLKSTGSEAPVVEGLQRRGLVERSLFTSFDRESLRAASRLEPRLRLGLSYPHDRHGFSRYRALAPVGAGALLALRQTLPARIGRLLEESGATVASLNHFVVSRRAVERCHDRGAAVLAWTVDSPRTVQRLVAAGVDAIITNDPRIL